MASRVKQAAVSVAKIGVAALLIYLLVSKGVIDLDAFQKMLSPTSALMGISLIGAGLLTATYRWLLLLKSQNVQITFLETFKLTLMGTFFNFAVPGGVGGDVVKIFYLLKKHPEARLTTATTVIMDRLLGLYSMLFMALVASLLFSERVFHDEFLFRLFLGVLAGFTAMTFFFVLAFQRGYPIERWIGFLIPHKKTKHSVESLILAIRSYREHPQVIARGLVVSLVSQVFTVMVVVVTGILMGFDLPVPIYFYLVPVGMVATIIPIAPAGVGVGQTALYLLFKAFDPATSSIGPVGMTAAQIYTFCWGLVGALLFVRQRTNRGSE